MEPLRATGVRTHCRKRTSSDRILTNDNSATGDAASTWDFIEAGTVAQTLWGTPIRLLEPARLT